MEKEKSRQGLGVPKRLDFKTINFHRRHSFSTPAGKLSTLNCGHPDPRVRNVVELDGAAAYICKDCFGHLMRIEVKAVVRREMAKVFGKLWPSRSLGRAVDYLLSRAMFAAYRGRAYWPWIALARLAARVAEKEARI